jgi:hypothetical protein
VEKLPADFLFGVGCSDHQCEAYDSAYPPDVWDWWEQDGKVPQSRGQAVDFWNRYPEHLRLAHELGCTTFRFSIAWARVEPSPGVFDPAVLQHYAELAAAAREQGMEPIVTLCHYVWPMHLERAGGLASADFPGRFAAYARRVRDALSPHVRYWITFNEPNDLVVSHSQFQSRFPPNSPTWTSFRDQMRGMEVLIRNIFLANRDARAVLHDVPSGPSAMVGMNTDLRGFPVGVRRLLNWWVTRYHQSAHHVRNIVGAIVPRRSTETLKPGPLNFLRTLVMLFDGDWSELGALGRLPRHLCPEGCANQLDYLAFDWYYGVRWVWDILKLTSSLDGHFERSPVYSPGLFETLRYFDRLFKAANPPATRPELCGYVR